MYIGFVLGGLFSLLAAAVGLVYHEGNGCGGLLTQRIVNITTDTFVGRSFDANHGYRRAVLNDSQGYCSDDTNSLQFLILKFGKPAILTGLAIQGQPRTNNSLVKFNMRYSLGNPTFWRYYEENGDSKTFDKVPSSGDDIIEYPLYATRMDTLLINPLFWNFKICMRIEVYGCLQVDGSFSSWSPWSHCNTSCGGGKNSRTRSCSSPVPANGGRQCNGAAMEYRNCSGLLCPVDGSFSSWSPWSPCNASCGGGKNSRTRSCSSPVPANGGRQCNGATMKYRNCSGLLCPANGGFSSWSEWSQCGNKCESAFQIRTRNCSNPPPHNNGRPCSGSWSESRSCTATELADNKYERASGTGKQDSYFLATWVLVAALSITIIVLLLLVVISQKTLKRRRPDGNANDEMSYVKPDSRNSSLIIKNRRCSISPDNSTKDDPV